MQKQEFEERIERTVTDEQYKVIEEAPPVSYSCL